MKLIVTYNECDPNLGGFSQRSRIFEIDAPELAKALKPQPYSNPTLSWVIDEKGEVTP